MGCEKPVLNEEGSQVSGRGRRAKRGRVPAALKHDILAITSASWKRTFVHNKPSASVKAGKWDEAATHKASPNGSFCRELSLEDSSSRRWPIDAICDGEPSR